MEEVCSYCQRKYGTISINNKAIFRTMDHIIPKDITSDISRNKRKKSVTNRCPDDEELLNLIQACNECNELKDSMKLDFLYKNLDYIYKNKHINRQYSYLTKEIVETIKNSIIIIQTKIPEPVIKDYLEYESN